MKTPGKETIEVNEKGQLLLNVHEVAKVGAASNYTRYNGGWVKAVLGIDKAQTNGYSLVGDFVQGTTWLNPGLYLDCSIAGSRKHPEKYYTLFRLTQTGDVESLATAYDTRDWAVRLWSAIETALGPGAEIKQQQPSKTAAITAQVAALSEGEKEEILKLLLTPAQKAVLGMSVQD